LAPQTLERALKRRRGSSTSGEASGASQGGGDSDMYLQIFLPILLRRPFRMKKQRLPAQGVGDPISPISQSQILAMT